MSPTSCAVVFAFHLRLRGLVVVAALALAACGSNSEPGALETVTVDGEQGLLTCSATPEEGLAQGMNAFSLVISEKASGAALEDARIEVTTWMPSMSHYTEGETVMPMGGGSYHIESVSLVMGGDWEIRYDVTGDAVGDTCVFEYAIP